MQPEMNSSAQASGLKLPDRILHKLNARHGVTNTEGDEMRDDEQKEFSDTGSMAQRMAMRRRQRSEARHAARGGLGLEAMKVEDSKSGPPAWHGLGLRDMTVDPKTLWQDQMVQQRKNQIQVQMNREQYAMEQQMLAREKRELERHRARVEARRSAVARKESPATAFGVQSHLKVG